MHPGMSKAGEENSNTENNSFIILDPYRRISLLHIKVVFFVKEQKRERIVVDLFL